MNLGSSSNQIRGRKMSSALLAAGCALLAVSAIVGISDNPPGVAAMIGGMSAVAAGLACRFGGTADRAPAQQLLYWAPRSLCVVIAVFLGLFALDVFGEGRGFWSTALAFIIHLVPSFLVLLFLAVAWRREWIGALLFLGLAVFYAGTTWNKPFAGSAIPLISGPLALTGALFLANWRNRVRRHPGPWRPCVSEDAPGGR